jgi:DNA-binding NtrC family response regulator
LRLLVVEDDPSVRDTLTTFLELEGYQVDAVSSTIEALKRLTESEYPIIISDWYLDEKTGLDVLTAARNANPSCAVILMSGRGTIENVMAATRSGAFDYIAKPFELDTMLDLVRRAEAAAAGPSDDEDDDDEVLPATELIGFSPPMVEVYKTIIRVADTEATVLIQGETGTGKELVAQQLHSKSKRAQQPFVAVDCAAISPSLLESELFGALKGSYTGADRDRVGALESANGGTVFLDEIGDIDSTFQMRLLRFLQEREIRPVGASRAKKVDVRVVAATNRDLAKLVDEGKFRSDLYFRLNAIPINLPPLRERRGDVEHLAREFVKRYNKRYNLSAELTKSGLRALQEYSWPGNVRQLQHLMERLTILAPQGRIDEAAVMEALAATTRHEVQAESLAETEMEQIRKVLQATGGNKSRAAKILGIERKTLYRKLERMKEEERAN